MDKTFKASIQSIGDPSFIKNIEDYRRELISLKYNIHPFKNITTKTQLKHIMHHYLAMSQAFPYLQAGAQKNLIFDCINNNKEINPAIEITSVIANFITWDETGGHALILDEGREGLLKIIDTNIFFHSNLLKKDLANLFSEPILPTYSNPTKQYLLNLFDTLSSLDNILRVASMFAFETHAEKMISTLWSKIDDLFPSIDKNTLEYFHTHVNDQDGAEEYHVTMTNLMVQKIVPEENMQEFNEKLDYCYSLSYKWCEDLLKYKNGTN